MNLSKDQIKQKIDALEKASKLRGGGPVPMLFDKSFQEAFIEALLKHGDNGNQVRLEMNEKGFRLSYKQSHVYMRQLFGTYTGTGRPPKYLKNSERRQPSK